MLKKIQETMLLVEHSLDFVIESSEMITLDEGEGRSNKEGSTFLRLTGVFQKGNCPNGNKRIYKTELLTREVKRFQSKITQGLAIGKVYHPSFFDPGGPAGVNDVSHRVTKLGMDGDVVRGELLVFKTNSGKDVAAINEGGGKIGISSRGRGSIERFDNVKIGGVTYKDVLVVSDDYRLDTFDLVLTPSVKTAIMRPVKNEATVTNTVGTNDDVDRVNSCNEQKNLKGGESSMTIEELKSLHPELYNTVHDAAIKEGKDLGAADAKAQADKGHAVTIEGKDSEITKLKGSSVVLTDENTKLKTENEELKTAKAKGDIRSAVTDAVGKSKYKDYFKSEDIDFVVKVSESSDAAVKEIGAREKAYESVITIYNKSATSIIKTGSKKPDTSESDVDEDNKAATEDFRNEQRNAAGL